MWLPILNHNSAYFQRKKEVPNTLQASPFCSLAFTIFCGAVWLSSDKCCPLLPTISCSFRPAPQSMVVQFFGMEFLTHTSCMQLFDTRFTSLYSEWLLAGASAVDAAVHVLGTTEKDCVRTKVSARRGGANQSSQAAPQMRAAGVRRGAWRAVATRLWCMPHDMLQVPCNAQLSRVGAPLLQTYFSIFGAPITPSSICRKQPVNDAARPGR